MEKKIVTSEQSRPVKPDFPIALCLLVLVLLVYWQVNEFDFVSFDDAGYLIENHMINRGISREGIEWSFRFPGLSYWHPVTWLSHMLDCEIYGMNPGMHHRTNLLLHICNTLLLFFVLKKMTLAVWQSAVVALFFGLHPINVESVAWVAERKNLLSTFFWFLTMWCYAFFLDRPRFSRYLLIIAAFILGLLSKPMLVTLPFVLLLIDFWPMRRLEIDRLVGIANIKLIIEKIPLFLLSGISILISSFSVQELGISISVEEVPMRLRIENALVSYFRYIGKILWPENLSVFYPFPSSIPVWQSASAMAVLVLMTVAVFYYANRKPYFLTGWLWFLGTLFPMMGLKQAGTWPAMADRWAYVPSIGVFIILSWSIFEFIEFKWKKIGIALVFFILTPAMMVMTWITASHWRDSRTLFENAVRVNPGNYIAHYNLADALRRIPGHEEKTILHYSEAIRIKPNHKGIYNDLGVFLSMQGDFDRGVHFLSRAAELNPYDAEIHNNLGLSLAEQGKFREAIQHFKTALKIEPGFLLAKENLENILKIQAAGKRQQEIQIP